MPGPFLGQNGGRILKVAAWCFAAGWAAYVVIVLLIYHVVVPTFVVPGAGQAFASEPELVSLAQSALRHAGEDPDTFSVRPQPDGGLVKRFRGQPGHVEIDFKSTKADLREFHITLIQQGGDVKCRVVPY